MSQVPSVAEVKKNLSKKSKVMIVVVIILAVTTIGVFGARELTLSRSLSPGNMILTSGEIRTVMRNSSRWNVAFLPSGNNIASADYTNASPVPTFGGNVTSPNIILAIIENSSNRSALSGYLYLESHLLSVSLIVHQNEKYGIRIVTSVFKTWRYGRDGHPFWKESDEGHPSH